MRAALARLIAPATLPRLVAPGLGRVAVVPAASSTAKATVIALGAVAQAFLTERPHLLEVVGVVSVHIVEDVE